MIPIIPKDPVWHPQYECPCGRGTINLIKQGGQLDIEMCDVCGYTTKGDSDKCQKEAMLVHQRLGKPRLW